MNRDTRLGGHPEKLTITNWIKNKCDYQDMEKEYPKGKIHEKLIGYGILKVKGAGS